MSSSDGPATNTRTLDHLIYLTPPGTLEETCKEFRELGFQVLPGGTHTDGLTANALIVLEDHVYLELIHFTRPVTDYEEGSPLRLKRETHPWSESFKKPGFITFSFLGNGSTEPSHSIATIINQRANLRGLSPLYTDEQPGGRTRIDGEVLKWLISHPQQDSSSNQHGTLPFFCGDVTPRSLRVPVDPPVNTEHSSGTKGVAFVRLVISSKSESPDLSTIAAELGAVLDRTPLSATSSEIIWEIETLNGGRKPHLIVSLPEDKEEQDFVKDNQGGIYQVGFWTRGGIHQGPKRTRYGGRLSWVL